MISPSDGVKVSGLRSFYPGRAALLPFTMICVGRGA